MPTAEPKTHCDPIFSLLERHRVLVCAGPGGVGKTTTAAALGICAALAGKRVVALTVDPSKRLLDALGVSGHATEPEPVRTESLGFSISGSLAVTTLDPARTLRSLIEAHAAEEQAKRILESKLYSTLSEQLAGLHEYMALERLLSLSESRQYDLLILDTPPASEALDFLEAPQRMVNALNSPVFRWLVASGDRKPGLAARLLSRGISGALNTLGTLTGTELLQQLATFVADMDRVLGGLQERAQTVATLLTGADVGFIVVAAPEADSVGHAVELAAALRARRLGIRGLVANRVERPWPVVPRDEVTRTLQELAQLGPQQASALSEQLERLAAVSSKLRTQQAAALRDLRDLAETNSTTLTEIPYQGTTAADPSGLRQVVQALHASSRPAS